MREVSRRSFLRGLVAAPVVAAVAPSIASCVQSSAAASVPTAEFGYLLPGREYWVTGFSTRAEALAEAVSQAGGAAFQTAEAASIPITYPNFAEACADWLMNEDGHLGNALVDALTCHNEEADFEGEFTDACNGISREPVGDAGRRALGAALRRLGADELAGKVEAGVTPQDDWEIPDHLDAALRADEALHAEIESAVRAWVEGNNLELEARGLNIAAVEDHPAAPQVVGEESANA